MSARASAVAAIAALVVLAVPIPSAQAAADRAGAIVVVIPADVSETLVPRSSGEPADLALRHFRDRRMAVGLVSTVQGVYDHEQALLDISQGTRQPRSLYGSDPPELAIDVVDGQARVREWDRVLRRASKASATISPGLLADTVRDGGAFVGADEATGPAVLAADRGGTVASFAPRSPGAIADRVREARSTHRLVVVAAREGRDGLRDADAIVDGRGTHDLVIAVHLPPTPHARGVVAAPPQRFYRQTAIGVSGRGWSGRLSSPSTRQPGLVATIDVLPTVLRHLGEAVPAQVRGRVMRSHGTADPARLESLRRRWADVRNGRQPASFGYVAALAALAVVAVGMTRGAAAGLRRGAAIFGLGALWWPSAALLFGAIEPRSRPLEVVGIAAVAVVAAILTAALVRWPTAPLVPAVAVVALVAVDLARGGMLLTRSVLAPSVATGNRFYGISNELEPVLPVVALAGLAALSGRFGPRRMTVVTALTGGALALVVGSGRLGADVGGTATVGAAFAIAVVVSRSARPSLRTVVIATAAVIVGGIAILVGVDFLSGAGAHLSQNLGRARGVGEVWELVVRRYELAAQAASRPENVVRLVIAAGIVAFGVRNRYLFADALRDRAWAAALIGGLAGGVAGALTNDSGPVLFVNAVVMVAAVAAYLASSAPSVAPTPYTVESGSDRSSVS